MSDTKIPLSTQTLKRLPVYLNFLKQLDSLGEEYASAPFIAKEMGLNEVQVRKDLSSVSTESGIPKKGFFIKTLIRDMAKFLGCDKQENAVIVGAGHLGKALMAYNGFSQYGLTIAAAFDNSEELVNTDFKGKKIYPMSLLPEFCKENDIKIGIITVPAAAAQEICDKLENAGILAVWNFAPTVIRPKKGMSIQNENLISSLAMLSKHIHS